MNNCCCTPKACSFFRTFRQNGGNEAAKLHFQPVDLTMAKPGITQNIDFVFFESADRAGADWDAAAPPGNLFLQRDYLRILEKHPPLGIIPGYIVFYRAGNPIGVALCQFKRFELSGSLSIDTDETPKNLSRSGFTTWLKKRISGSISADALVIGNLLMTGNHGIHFQPETAGTEQINAALASAIDAITQHAPGKKISLVLVKDVPTGDRWATQHFNNTGYYGFQIQPNMVMDLPFANFEAYLDAMSTKYRTRVKRAFKKLGGITFQENQLSEISQRSPQLHAMYQAVAKNAGFNLVDLNPKYLEEMKAVFGERFRLFTLHHQGEIVGFYTIIHNGATMEAHFLGYHKDLNTSHQIYLNILIEIVRNAIAAGVSRLVFARTAPEIKSSIGAVPEQLNNFLRHENRLLNQFTALAMNLFNPKENWVQRHPFKHPAP